MNRNLLARLFDLFTGFSGSVRRRRLAGVWASASGDLLESRCLLSAAPRLVSFNSIVGADVSTTAAYELRFSEPVMGLDTSDFNVVASPAVSWQSLVLTGSGSEWTVTVGGINGSGTLRVATIDDGSIHDADGNPLFGNRPFTASDVSSDTPMAWTMAATGDFDGDGRDEVVYRAIRQSTEFFPVLEHLEIAPDGSKSVVPVNINPQWVDGLFAADLTGDGREELLVVSQRLLEVLSFNMEGQSTSLFRADYSSSINFFPDWTRFNTSLIRDFTADGLPDMAVETRINGVGGMQIFAGDGAGRFTLGQFIPFQSAATNFQPHNYVAGDVNNDGISDLVLEEFPRIPGREDTMRQLRVLVGAPNGLMVQTAVYPNRGLIGGSALLRDLNADGFVDLMARDLELGICVFPGAGNGTFAAVVNLGYQSPGNFTSSILDLAVADFNADGLNDVLVYEHNATVEGPEVFVTKLTPLQQTTAGVFLQRSSYSLSSRSARVSRMPLQQLLDSQHGLELHATASGSLDDLGSSSIERVLVDSSFAIEVQQLTTQPGLLQSSLNADFDGDQITDTLFLANNVAARFGSAAAYATDLHFLFRNAPGDTQTPIRSVQTVGEPPGNRPEFVMPADLNLDGLLDLISLSATTDTLNFHPSVGNGRFSATQHFSVGDGPIDAVAADFNLDERVDLAVLNSAGGSMTLLYAHPDQTLSTPIEIPVGQMPKAIDSGDMNLDGYPDLVVAVPDSYQLAIFATSLEGVSQQPEIVSLVIRPELLQIADLNADAQPDIVVGSRADNRVIVLMRTLSGFAVTSTITPQDRLTDIALDDFNADGIVDIFYLERLNQFSGTNISYGSANGQYSLPESLAPPAYNMRRLVVADINGGGPDLIIGTEPPAPNQVAVYSPVNSFSQKILNWTPLHQPEPFTVGDFTGDGRLDIAAVELDKDAVRIIANTTTAVADSSIVYVYPNLPPTRDTISPITALEDTLEIRIPVTGISPGQNENQPVRLVITGTSDPDLIPLPTFIPGQNPSTGTILLKPTKQRSGTASIYCYLEDAGRDGLFQTTHDNAYNYNNSTLSVTITATRAVVISPVGSTALQTPLLSWTAVPEAAQYRVWISNSSTAQNPLVLTTVSNTQYVPTVNLGIGRIDVWIQAVLADGRRLPWSVQHRFEIRTRTEIAPLPTQLSTARPRISLTTVPGADAYEIYLSNLSTGVAGAVRTIVVAPEWTPTADLDLSRWRVWARALVRGKFNSDWSLPRDFTVVAAPVPIGPAVFTVNQRPDFQWQTVAGADRYGFQLRNPRTGQVIINVTGLTTNSFTPTTPLPFDHYRWWVFAEASGSSVRSEWSVGTDVAINNRPVLLGPSGNVSTTNTLLTWLPFPNAIRYEVWISRTTPSLATVLTATNVQQPSFELPSTLPRNVSYRYWTRAVTSTNTVTDWSQPLDFKLV